MASISRRAGIATACATVKVLASFLGKHRQSIIDTTTEVLPAQTAAITAAIDAIIATVSVFQLVCTAWENAVHG